MGWGNKSIPFFEVVSTVSWDEFFEAFDSEINAVVMYFETGVCYFYGRQRARRGKLILATLGLLFPVMVLGPGVKVLGLLAIAPVSVISVFAGLADGEFYVEEMPQYGAMGLWMWLCLFLIAKHTISILQRFDQVRLPSQSDRTPITGMDPRTKLVRLAS